MAEINVRALMLELKTLTNPVSFGIGLGFPDHEMELLKKDNPLDIDGQKLALFLKISRNCVAMEITWEKIADTLEEFVDKRNLAQQIRTKFCRPPVEERFKCPDDKIDFVAQKVGIYPSTLDKPCSNETHLLQIAQLLRHWPSYVPYLGLTDQEMTGIQQDVTLTTFHSKPHRMLQRWQEKKAFTSEGHYRYLLQTCLEIHDSMQLIEDICKLLK